jgi:hypothetical protein
MMDVVSVNPAMMSIAGTSIRYVKIDRINCCSLLPELFLPDICFSIKEKDIIGMIIDKCEINLKPDPLYAG